MLAIHHQRPDIVKLLVQHGAKIVGLFNGLQPWPLACQQAAQCDMQNPADKTTSVEIVKALANLIPDCKPWNEVALVHNTEELEKKINRLGTCIPGGFNGLHKLLEDQKLDSISRTELLKVWLRSHFGPLLKNEPHPETGDTLLITAAKQGLLPEVNLLVQQQVDLNRQNHRGETALILAAAHGHEHVVAALLKADATYWLKDKQGRTALDAVTASELPATATRQIIITLEESQKAAENQDHSFIPLLVKHWCEPKLRAPNERLIHQTVQAERERTSISEAKAEERLLHQKLTDEFLKNTQELARLEVEVSQLSLKLHTSDPDSNDFNYLDRKRLEEEITSKAKLIEKARAYSVEAKKVELRLQLEDKGIKKNRIG